MSGPLGEVAGLLGRVSPDATPAHVAAAGSPEPGRPVGAGQPGEGRAGGPPTRSFGPRPPRPEPAAPAEAPWRWVAPAAIALLVVPVVAVALLQSRRDTSPAPAIETARPLAAPSPMTESTAGCQAIVAPTAGPDETVLVGDLDGSGCRSWVRWRGNVLDAALDPDAPPRAYEVGVPGDALALGDWDCDGSETPGLYRPSSGEVFLFDDWAGPDDPLQSRPANTSGVRDGTPEVVADGACDRLEITGT